MSRLFRRTHRLSAQPIGPWPGGELPLSPAKDTAIDPVSDTGQMISVAGRGPLSLFRPTSYEAKYPYPLLVWLLGDGLDETAMLRLMPKVSLRNFGAIGLPASAATRQRWPRGHRQKPRDLLGEDLDGEADLFSAVRFARRRLHVHTERIFLIGIGEGATRAFEFGLASPDCFAGIAALDGAFPPSAVQPLACLPRARRVPLFLAQRMDSRGRLRADSPATRRLLHTAGFAVEAHAFHGQTLPSEVFSHLNRWVMARLA